MARIESSSLPNGLPVHRVHLDGTRSVTVLVAFEAGVLAERRDSNQSHLRMSYRPSIDPRAPADRAALAVYSTLLGGSMGSRLFDEIREQRGLAYSVYSVDHAFADVPILQLSAGLDSSKA